MIFVQDDGDDYGRYQEAAIDVALVDTVLTATGQDAGQPAGSPRVEVLVNFGALR